MFLYQNILTTVKQREVPRRVNSNLYFLLFIPFVVVLINILRVQSPWTETLSFKLSNLNHGANKMVSPRQTPERGSFEARECQLPFEVGCSPDSTFYPTVTIKNKDHPYHNWELFKEDYQEMLQKLKIFVYPDVFSTNSSSPFSNVFRPHPNSMDPKIGNYFSEHVFKMALLNSSLVTQRPEEANFFFMPFSINVMRNHPLLHSETSISNFIAHYIEKISSEFEFWNASGGSDHFFVCCHSVGREASSKSFALHNNAIQITCSSSYFQRFFTAHKDIALPQIWPRHQMENLNPPHARKKRVFFAGRLQNSRIREEIFRLWGNDTAFDIFQGHSPFPYEEGFMSCKYCLHVKGYEVNTARVVDAIHFGCIPVLISDHYDLPFAHILDWSKFSIIISHRDVGLLKHILTMISEEMYLSLYKNLCMVRRHFMWYTNANGSTSATYDSFHMTAYQLWLRRGLLRFTMTA